MKIVSWNVNGIRAVHRNGFWDGFLKLYPDIFCLQETKASPDQLNADIREVPGFESYFCSSTTKKGYSGVATYTKVKPLQVEYGLNTEEFDCEGRQIAAHFKDFSLINCYFPNGGRGPERIEYKLRYYDAFLAYCEKLRKTQPNIIFCGDVNTAHTEIDLARPKENSNTTGFLPVEREWIDTLTSVGYVDVYRSRYPSKKDMYTYWDQITRSRERNVGWRIDYFFATPSANANIAYADIHTNVMGSDHCPISIEADF
jgi:exodeoxyribonuclease III